MLSRKCASMAEVGMENQETIPLLSPKNIWPVPSAPCFFSTRRGGSSLGSHASLNLGEHVGDDAKAVANNRGRVQKALAWHGGTRDHPHSDARPNRVCHVNQVHGTTTVEADHWPTPPDADALVTDQRGITLAILVADCAPVLFADAEAQVIGAAHAGWRGSVSGILESCLDAMIRLGARRERIHALIGPCIRQPSYHVNETFREELLANPHNKIAEKCQKFFTRPGKVDTILFDLPGYIQERLVFHGLLKERTYDAMLCTYKKEDTFFSHRRATQRGLAPCGRHAGYIFLA